MASYRRQTNMGIRMLDPMSMLMASQASKQAGELCNDWLEEEEEEEVDEVTTVRQPAPWTASRLPSPMRLKRYNATCL